MHSQIKIIKTKFRSICVVGMLMDINKMKTLKLGNDNRLIKAVRNVPFIALSRRIAKGCILARRKTNPEERITKQENDKYRNRQIN